MTSMVRTGARALIATAAIGAVMVTASLPAGAVVDDEVTTVQILGVNDFHGRILPNGEEAGAAVLAGAVTQLRAENPNTVFAAAGDLIGASTFESFVAQDKPTIDALNAAGLEVSAVGNHEFDQGYDDLVNRVMAPYDADTNPYGGALWEYLGANVRDAATGDPALPETWTVNVGGVDVGFVGAVTDHLGELVSPAGIEGLEIEDPVVAANRSADQLKANGADLVILLVHEGATTTALADAVNPASDFGAIVTGANANIDGIVSGHTHLAYNHEVPVQAWIDEGRTVTTRPVVSAGQYGMYLNQLNFDVNAEGDVVGLDTAVINLATGGFTPDPEVAAIVTAADDNAAVLGAEVLGTVDAPLYRGIVSGGALGSNRGGESTLGNAVAEVQRWATADAGADIAFMNPGGMRTDLLGLAAGTGTYPSDVTYEQAANVQPFANTLVTQTLTGAQIKSVLEEQWQPTGAARPFLSMGTSAGFTYTYDPAAVRGEHILQMWLNGEQIQPTDTFTVTANSFLASGGDNFATLAQGTNKRDSGRVDLAAMVDYLDTFGTLEVDYAQHSVGVSGLEDTEFTQGEEVTLNLSSLMMNGPSDVVDKKVRVRLGGKNLGAFPVTNALSVAPNDEAGTATVTFTVPNGKKLLGDQELTIEGLQTGTLATLAVSVVKATPPVCTVDYTVHGSWPGGFISQVWLTNTSSEALSGWSLDWAFNGNEHVANLWSGDATQTGADVSVANLPWNGSVAPGASVTFGFVGTGSPANEPAEFALNGAACVVK